MLSAQGPTESHRGAALAGSVLVLGAMLGASLVLQRAALADLAPLAVALFRLLAGLAFFIPLLPHLRLGQLRTRRVLLDVGVVGALCPGLSILCLTFALQFASSGLVALLTALAPLFAAGLGSLGSTELTLCRRQLAGIAAACGGAVLLLATRSTGLGAGDGDVLGPLLAVANAGCYAASAVYAGRRLRTLDPLTLAAGQTAAGLLVLAPVVGVLGVSAVHLTPLASVAVLLSGALGLGGVFLLQARMVRAHGSTATLLALYVMPIAAGLLGVALLGEAVTAPLAAGAALVLLGLSLYIGPLPFVTLRHPWLRRVAEARLARRTPPRLSEIRPHADG
jgi:drug/metabolite transporter (DMT)-like permease